MGRFPWRLDMPPTSAKPLPSPLDGAPFAGPAVHVPARGLEELWPNTLPRYVEVCGVLQGEACGEPLASVASRLLSEVEDEVREALAGASSRDPAASALRQALTCGCRLGVALSTLPDFAKDADEEGIAGLLGEVEAARAALREAKKADPKSAALVAAERRLSAFALDFARATARAGLKGKGHGPKRPPAPPPPAANGATPTQTAEEIAREFREDAPVAPAPQPKARPRLLVGLAALGASGVAAFLVNLSLSESKAPPPPKVPFAPEGSFSQVGEHTGVSFVDLGKDATADQVASFKAAAAAQGKTVRQIAPGQFIFTHERRPDAGAAEVPADAGAADSPDPTERAP